MVLRQRTRLLACSILFCLASCQSQNVPVGVSGTVTVDGYPLTTGLLVLEPTDPSRGQMRQAEIREGTFTLPDAEGVLSGTEFRVVIRAFRSTGKRLPYQNPDGTWDEFEQYLPAKYNSESSLKVVVSPEPEANRFTFDLQTNSRKR